MNEGSGQGNGWSPDDGHGGQERVQAFAHEASAQFEHARLVFDDLNRRVVEFVRERPGTALVGALAVGWLVGKIASRGK
jgi:hypothetical protein